MPDSLTDAQRQFLQLLHLSVPGDPPPEMTQAKAPASTAPPKRPTPAPAGSVPGSPRSAEAAAAPSPAPPPAEDPVAVPQKAAPALSDPPPDPQRLMRIATLDWLDLGHMITACRACSLGETRKHAVVGAGNPRGSWLFVGEAPGAEEDRRGEAFVGRGGQLLDAMLHAMGLSRENEVYIANILKCRPPNNRDPLGPEVHACIPYLQRQIALLQPRIIVALGRFAAQGLLQVDTPLAKLRGTPQQYQGIPLIVTYHPAYLLRNPIDKRKVWEDLKRALEVFAALQK